MKANDMLAGFTGTNHYYGYYSMRLTDGSVTMANDFQCYWLLDIIWSYQPKLSKMPGSEFQVWKLKKNENDTAKVWCEDGNGNTLISQKIPYTDFKADEAELWVEGNVVLLPSEH